MQPLTTLSPPPPEGWEGDYSQGSTLTSVAEQARKSLSSLLDSDSRAYLERHLYRRFRMDELPSDIAQAFKINLHDLPYEVARLLSFVAIAADVPMAHMTRPNTETWREVYLSKVALGVSLLQADLHGIGTAILQDVAQDLDVPY